MRPLLLAATLLPLALSAFAEDRLYSNSYKGKEPPELVSGPADWINTDAPLSLRGLKGKVVYLEFGFLH